MSQRPSAPGSGAQSKSTLHRRQLLRFAAVGAASLAAPQLRAQTPPLRFLVGYPAGSTVDISARLLAEHMREPLGRSIVVENRVGAASRIAMEALRVAKPDGNTLAVAAHGPMTLFAHLYPDLRYDPFKDFTPISQVNSTDYCICAGPLAKVSNLEELRRWTSDPGQKASFGSPGEGSVPHFIGMALASKAKMPWQHVPYKGSPLAINDVIGGQLACAITPLMDALDKHKGGLLRILATTGTRRSPLLPAVPTLQEVGIDIQVSAWLGLYGPAGVPPAQAEALNRAAQAALSSNVLKEKFAGFGFTAEPGSAQALAQLQRNESQMWGALVKATGFTPGT